MSPEKNPSLESLLKLLLLVVTIVGGLLTIRKELREQTQPPEIAKPSKPAPAPEDIKTGSIQKKVITKPKLAPEPPVTLFDWVTRQFEADPLRDKYTRD